MIPIIPLIALGAGIVALVHLATKDKAENTDSAETEDKPSKSELAERNRPRLNEDPPEEDDSPPEEKPEVPETDIKPSRKKKDKAKE